MKKFVLPFLLLAVASATTAGDAPRVSRAVILSTEKSFDERVARMWNDNPLALLGSTRGVYLDGYGAVFTAEVNMVTDGVSLMRLTMTKDEKDKYRQKKLDRLPQLRKLMKQALLDSAASLDPVPADEQVVVAVILSRYQWEDASGIPAQIVMQASRRKLLEARQAGGATLDAAVRVTEY